MFYLLSKCFSYFHTKRSQSVETKIFHEYFCNNLVKLSLLKFRIPSKNKSRQRKVSNLTS